MAGFLFPAKIFLLLLGVAAVQPREITHEDIKDAMLSLVHMMRENTEKLERHEARERQLGEQIKRAIAQLAKQVSTSEGLKLAEERIIGLEQMMIQRDERERIQLEKITGAMNALEHQMSGRIREVENLALEMMSDRGPSKSSSNDGSNEILEKLKETEHVLANHVAKLETATDYINHLIPEHANQNEKINKLLTQVRDIESDMSGIQTSLQKMEESSRRVDQNESPNLGTTLEEQNRALARVASLLEQTSTQVQELSKSNRAEELHNDTQTSLQETKHVLKGFVLQEIHDIKDSMAKLKDETRREINEFRVELIDNVRKMGDDIKDLGRGESLMVEMADHVLDTKKRVEYGVHQILLEVGDLVNKHSSNINDTIHNRFDDISNDILFNQKGGMANLTLKMEQEMNQVWRQINAMYQQMMDSAKTLDKLHEQNEAYVAGTTSTMGGMESKVSEIRKRMLEVDENLNYLLGRLSLVTQEFNQIKTGLGDALDNIKASFKEVEDKANDLSPGPHPVPEHHKELDEENPSVRAPQIVSSNS